MIWLTGSAVPRPAEAEPAGFFVASEQAVKSEKKRPRITTPPWARGGEFDFMAFGIMAGFYTKKNPSSKPRSRQVRSLAIDDGIINVLLKSRDFREETNLT
jgi:hypothetical protein